MAKVVTPHSGNRLHVYKDAWWIALCITAVALTFWTWAAAVASGLLAHASPALVSWNQTAAAIPSLLAHPLQPQDAYPADAGVGGPLAFYPPFLAVAAGTCWGTRAGWRRWRAMRDEGTDGLATSLQLEEAMGEAKALSRLGALRPSLATPRASGKSSPGPTRAVPWRAGPPKVTDVPVSEVAVFCGTAIPTGVKLYIPLEETVLIVAPPREGKTSQLIMPWILDFPGSVLATSSKTDVLYATAKSREKLGPVMVLDPTGLSNWPLQLQWSLVDGCEDFTVARKRAETLTGTAKSDEGTKNGGYFVMNAQMLMTCWLHAAALQGLSGMDILRWATSPTERQPVDILAAHNQPNLARALAAQHAAAPEERSASWRTAEQSILALYDTKVAAIFGQSARGENNFSIARWLTEGGTVFLIGEEEEGSSLAPIMAAFSRAILDTAKVIAARMPNGRLDPPLALLGDELANVAPLPQIPSLMSVSGSQNIFMVAVLQNLAQAHERWGELGVRKMFAAATIKVILGGVSDEQELKTYSQLAGEFEEDTESVSDDGDRASISISTRRRAVLEPGDIRQIKEREGLVVHRRTPVTRVRFERIHEGPRAKEISDATREALKKVNSHTSH
ncbi:TraM recognition domain-containing protein [Streptomyces xinghaiensis]|uniref:Type IV secretion system protein VirD4 n=2 Tax=Streptomyces TaxID=1883 RepID=A0A3R7HWT3_9ACTN|nr:MULTISPECIES: TraM recognition domain-containing protein [Streptomyces]KNE83363.1 Type IV secretory pathway VirD4-like protein [Streptomyces fradiae]OFA34137.1 type IV secretion system protein VirD4 [Streptomyces fradiae]PQM20548.1 type IV secretion system protein VirD4 [Streptomyces xinghaiensis]RKM92490.1 type IV secretion system protein VirD4 [Streptomyces xinghaiensis]RNC70457.1 type IV secretion system protein VirD4 [Streptomyces xinghaiensis]